LQPSLCGSVVGGVEFDAEIAAAECSCSDRGGAGTGEGIEHQPSGGGKALNQRHQHRQGLLGGVQLIAGVAPWDDIADGIAWLLRVSLGQQISRLVLIADHSAR